MCESPSINTIALKKYNKYRGYTGDYEYFDLWFAMDVCVHSVLEPAIFYLNAGGDI